PRARDCAGLPQSDVSSCRVACDAGLSLCVDARSPFSTPHRLNPQQLGHPRTPSPRLTSQRVRVSHRVSASCNYGSQSDFRTCRTLNRPQSVSHPASALADRRNHDLSCPDAISARALLWAAAAGSALPLSRFSKYVPRTPLMNAEVKNNPTTNPAGLPVAAIAATSSMT